MNRKLKEKTRIDGEKRTKHDAHTALPLAHCCLHPLSAPCRLSNLINRMRKRTIATHHRKRSTIFKQMYGPTLHQARCCAVQIRKRFLFILLENGHNQPSLHRQNERNIHNKTRKREEEKEENNIATQKQTENNQTSPSSHGRLWFEREKSLE